MNPYINSWRIRLGAWYTDAESSSSTVSPPVVCSKCQVSRLQEENGRDEVDGCEGEEGCEPTRTSDAAASTGFPAADSAPFSVNWQGSLQQHAGQDKKAELSPQSFDT